MILHTSITSLNDRASSRICGRNVKDERIAIPVLASLTHRHQERAARVRARFVTSTRFASRRALVARTLVGAPLRSEGSQGKKCLLLENNATRMRADLCNKTLEPTLSRQRLKNRADHRTFTCATQPEFQFQCAWLNLL